MKKFTYSLIIAFAAILFSGTAFGQVTQRGSSTNASSTNTTLTINKPTGVIAGDVMIVNIANENNGTDDPILLGWTPVGSGAINGGDIRGSVLYKVATGSEPASYAFALGTGTNDAVGTIVAFFNVDVSGPNPFDGVGTMGLSVAAGSLATAPGITTTFGNSAVIMFGQQSDNRQFSNWNTTSPGALTPLYVDEYNSANDDLSIGAAWAIKGSAGVTGDGTADLEDANDRWGAILLALKQKPPTVTINPPALSISTILVGGSLALTANRSVNASWPNGNGNFQYTWSATGPAVLSFTSNPNTITGTSSATSATGFSVAGTYNITCTVQEQGSGGLTIASISKTVNVLAVAPTTASLWATSTDGTQISSFVVANGTYFSGPSNIFAPTFGGPNGGSSTAALGKSADPTPATGYFYYLPNTGNNDGVIDIYGATSTGSSIAVVGTIDINGAGTNDLGFVRLGMGPDGTGWILAGDGSTVYLAKFIPNGLLAATVSLEDANGITLTGGTASTFVNGDLCVSGTGTIYSLANNGSGVTQIFRGTPNGNLTAFTKVFDLVDNNLVAFTGSVNGVAFDLIGSIYLSTSSGLYYVDAATVNGPAGTVGCFLVQTVSGLQDLASNVFPTNSPLPVKLGSFFVTKQGSNAVIDWTTITETNTDHFEIERSLDGINFTTVGTKQAAGSSSSVISYQYFDPITNSAKIIYYRLKTVDADANKSVSKIVALRLNGIAISDFTVYPNPFTSDLKIQISSVKEMGISIRVSNALGQQVISRKAMLQSGENIVVLSSELAKLQTGMYMLEIISEEGKMTQKIIKR